MNKNIVILFLFLLVLPTVTAINITSPVDSYTYYNNILEVSMEFNESEPCWYVLNNEITETFPCSNNFIIDIPYDEGTANLTFYQTSDNQTLNIFINDKPNDAEGFTALAITLIPFILAILFSYIAYNLDENHTPLKIFFFIFTFINIVLGLNVSSIVARDYIHNQLLEDILDGFIYNWTLYIIIFYFLIYLIAKIFIIMQERKKRFDNPYD